ncbi:MAG: phenylpyruvate tautomerase MIF-related protein [Mariprofundus sp.]|nr:phenylpyruvate tautomerase MIF-related protein [Mariprofundus sp.]
MPALIIHSSQTAGIFSTLCSLLRDELGIDAGHVYIEFAAPECAMFGWNGGAF